MIKIQVKNENGKQIVNIPEKLSFTTIYELKKLIQFKNFVCHVAFYVELIILYSIVIYTTISFCESLFN